MELRELGKNNEDFYSVNYGGDGDDDEYEEYDDEDE